MADLPIYLFIIILVVEILVAVAAIVVQVLLSLAFGKCAAEKGYPKMKYFWICFFLGLLGGCLVAALPDRTLNEKVSKINGQLLGR